MPRRGIDPQRSVVFNQAQVPAHAEMQWLLNGTARMGWLNRMTQWKDKAGKNREGASIALFTYPVLQAADVLLYQTTHVPVGDDQKQHLELANDIAEKFNHDFSAEGFFPRIEPLIDRVGTRLGYAVALAGWSASSMLHALAGGAWSFGRQSVTKRGVQPLRGHALCERCSAARYVARMNGVGAIESCTPRRRPT